MASSVPLHFAADSEGGVRATVSLLRNLTEQAEATLHSALSSLFSHPYPCSSSHGAASAGERLFPDSGFCCCLYDHRHRMPPQSLFRHSLRCAAAPGGPLLDLGFLGELRYPGTLKSEAELREENSFVRPLSHSGADLCFSLEKELEGVEGSSFFYRDCPGVVTYPEPDVSSRTFTLPAVLAVECANFVCSSGDMGRAAPGRDRVSILPSDFWALEQEVGAWKDYPERYSYMAARVASSMREGSHCDMKKWIISTSPQSGILIDAAMRDHIFLLLKLCLKAVWREASGSLQLSSGGAGALNPRSLCFKCPCLFQASSWLASQLSILYGETNGKSFAISMIAETLVRFGTTLLLCPSLECGDAEGRHGINPETHETKLDTDVTNGHFQSVASEGIEFQISSGNFCTGQVFVSQVAAAVAALHERSLLEEKLKLLRFPRLLSKWQLLDEHYNVSMKASEVRAKRSNYRPILENDGLLWQKPQNQNTGRPKTREELLAEERDYKRRRMSYRGKKVKRTTVQVIRDIIEDQMEVLKQSGGVECNIKGPQDSVMLISGSGFQGDVSSDGDMVKEKESEPSGVSSRDVFVSKKLHCAEFHVSSCVPGNAHEKHSYSTDHYLNKEKDTRESRYVSHKMHLNSDSIFVRSEHMDHEYGGPANYRIHKRSNDRYTHQRETDGKEASWRSYDKRNNISSHYFKREANDSSLSSSSMTKEEYGHAEGRRKQSKGRNGGSHRSESMMEFMFEDRYDPHEDASTDASPKEK